MEFEVTWVNLFTFGWTVCSLTALDISFIICILTNNRSRSMWNQEFSLNNKNSQLKLALRGRKSCSVDAKQNDNMLMLQVITVFPLKLWLVSASWCTVHRLDWDEQHCSQIFQSLLFLIYAESTQESFKEELKF